MLFSMQYGGSAVCFIENKLLHFQKIFVRKLWMFIEFDCNRLHLHFSLAASLSELREWEMDEFDFRVNVSLRLHTPKDELETQSK